MSDYEIPSSRPDYGSAEREAVHRVLNRNYTAEGPEAEALENELADFLACAEAEVTHAGTSALHLALLSLQVDSGDEVIIPSYTCLAVMNAVTQTGANLVVADVDPDTMCLSAQSVRKNLSDRTSAIILVHNFGYRVETTELYGMDVPVIDDFAQGFGSEPFESGPRGRIAVGSFYATKSISAGQGGFVATDDSDLMGRVRDLKTYDKRDAYRKTYNYSLSDLSAAVARVQLDSLPDRIRKRRRIATRYTDRFSSLPTVDTPLIQSNHSFYRYVIQTPQKSKLLEKLHEASIEAKSPVYKPLHQYKDRSTFPVTDELHQQALMLPVYSNLTEDEVDFIATTVESHF